MDARRPCPDSALLAAFIDGTLVDDDRSAVVAHLTECGACRCTAENVAAFQEVLERERSWESAALPRKAVKVTKSRPRRRWTREQTRVIALTLAAAAALAVVVYPLTSTTHDEPASPLTELVDASGGPRPITARVSGGFRYGPPPALRPGPTEERGRWRLASAAGRIREAYEDDPLTTSQHAVGVAALVVGRFDDAVSSLFRAAAAAPADPQILNDLAAAYYERAVAAGHADDLPRALSVAERVLEQWPDSADGWFNRALIIEALGLRRQARDAWNVYLQKDKTSPWTAEARDHLTALPVSPGANDWPGIRQKLETAPDQATVDESVRRFASRVREYLDRDVLTAWASAVERGENASVFLQRATMISDAFLRLAGDDTYSDALAIVHSVAKEGHVKLLALARAHRDYGDGLRLAAVPRIAEAGATLRRAESTLSAFGSPLGLRAQIEIAGTEYLAGRLETAHKSLANVKAAALAGDYSNLVARAEWLTGLIAFARHDFGAAQIGYEEMFQSASAAGDLEQVAFAHGLLANLHELLGDAVSAWRHRVDGAALLDEVSNPIVAANLLLSAAVDASASGNNHAALVFQSAILRQNLTISPATETQVLANHARIQHRLGQHTAALHSLQLAHDRLSRVSDDSIHGRIEPDVLAADSEFFKQADPARAIAAAERALTFPSVQRDALRVARLTATLAEAAMNGNELDRADNALQQGIAALERFRSLPSAEMRIPASDPSWSLFVRAIQLALLRGNAARAFEYSERRRIQTSFEHRRWGERVVSLDELQRQLPADTGIAVLNQLDDHLQVWVIRQRQVNTHTVSMTRGAALSLVTSHLYEVAGNTPTPKLTGDLFDRLFLPAMPALTGVRNLVVVPDAPYHRVAFAALWDRTRDRYLVEDRAIVTAPSATAYVWALSRGREIARSGVRHAVIIESPTADGAESQSDARIPATDREVAALYADAEVRRGTAATAERLLHSRDSRDVIHVAAPLHPNDEFPFLSRLLLADIPGRKHSGAVFARHVSDTELSHARLVTLQPRGERNAATTGQGALGFARALFAAGVPNIVGPIAAVKPQSLDQTWLEFHRHYVAGLSAAESLRQAQLTALSESNHRPGPWAMLTVFGSTQ